jgi:hypothetical protein
VRRFAPMKLMVAITLVLLFISALPVIWAALYVWPPTVGLVLLAVGAAVRLIRLV